MNRLTFFQRAAAVVAGLVTSTFVPDPTTPHEATAASAPTYARVTLIEPCVLPGGRLVVGRMTDLDPKRCRPFSAIGREVAAVEYLDEFGGRGIYPAIERALPHPMWLAAERRHPYVIVQK